MRYKVYNKQLGRYEDDQCVVKQDGDIAFEDDSGGLCTAVDQFNYEIEVGELILVKKSNKPLFTQKSTAELNEGWIKKIDDVI